MFLKSKKNTEIDTWNLLWERYVLKTLDLDYLILCEYYNGINGEGHHVFLDNNAERLDLINQSLQKLLPELFYSVFLKVYQKYISGKNVEDVCNEADDYFYQNEKVIERILFYYAQSLKRNEI